MSDEPPARQKAPSERDLSPRQREQLRSVLEALERDEHAPTAIRDPREAAGAHVADSLVALQVDGLREARSIADLGAGAGFPGLPLAVALPRARVSLVESQRRKCEFLRRASASAEIENALVVCARAEEWGDGLGANEAVVARALAAQPVVLEYAAPLLALGGTLVDWRGRRSETHERASAAAAEMLGLRRLEIRRVEPFEGATDRHLHVFEKSRETPPRYPRRAGVARKRPLAG
ncbi:MAG TPA: 16S rRNA (guanine(527)-N(7))-methyltransferase RsmG [Solirubrobacteraceae bacterium]|jgi:16S rRNA (guanine527-N7)-methyltransferase|nr:16S rRNA (guanine(527)-N(7))-methyltransferase RsmG [Solirubrobacteraceae bacterium]